jgi:hypothetical protein
MAGKLASGRSDVILIGSQHIFATEISKRL